MATARVQVGKLFYDIRSLENTQQYSDPQGVADRAGISSANWSLFGVLWPASRVMAEEMDTVPILGKRILEVGCGLGLASLVLQRRGADISACDYHPLAGEFLRHNSDMNALLPIPYFHAPWEGPNPDLGTFDLIIGSDLLYERGHPELLATFLECHARPTAQVLLCDPGRGRCGQFGSRMAVLGYGKTERWMAFHPLDVAPHPGRIMSFRRGEGQG